MTCDHRFMTNRMVTFTAIQVVDGCERFDIRVRDAMQEFFALQKEADALWGVVAPTPEERRRQHYLQELRLGAGFGEFKASNGVMLSWSSSSTPLPSPRSQPSGEVPA